MPPLLVSAEVKGFYKGKPSGMAPITAKTGREQGTAYAGFQRVRGSSCHVPPHKRCKVVGSGAGSSHASRATTGTLLGCAFGAAHVPRKLSGQPQPKSVPARARSVKHTDCAVTSRRSAGSITARKCSSDSACPAAQQQRKVKDCTGRLPGAVSSKHCQSYPKRGFYRCHLKRPSSAPLPVDKRVRVAPRKPTVGANRVHMRPVAAPGRCAPCSDEDIGSVWETHEEHRKRHADPLVRRSCPRCQYLELRPHWHDAASSHGTSTVQGRKLCWLTERPKALGGAWALGCCICAGMARSKLPGRNWRANGKWARFEVRRLTGKLASGALDVHASSSCHRRALWVCQSPNFLLSLATPVGDNVQGGGSVEAAWKGRVPQPEDWVEAMAESCEAMSYRKVERVAAKKSGKRQGCLRKRRVKQTRIMAEVTRRRLRDELRKATSISLALDAKGKRKIVRFRCDSPNAGLTAVQAERTAASGIPCIADGVLGVLTWSTTSLDTAAQDYGERSVAAFVQFLTAFCTPLKEDFDEGLYRHITEIVRAFAADGAASERKALFMIVRAVCPNVIMVIRDIAHAVRIAAQKTLHADDVFGAVWKELFDKKHALVPDIKYSEKYRELLQLAQEHVLTIPGRFRPIDIVIKYLSFAKQRFDSFADPAAKLSLMLLPVVVLLANIASDVRCEKERRARAIHVLKLLKPKFCLALGLSADLGLLVKWFLRLFDQSDHDIACSVRELEHFEGTLDAVFKHGWVFCARSKTAGLTAQELPGRFVSDIVEEQLKKKCVLRAGAEHILMWGECPPEEVRDLASRSQLVVDSMIHRLHADYDADLLRRSLVCFDLLSVRSACKKCVPGLKDFAKAAGENPDRASDDYRDVFRVVLQEFERLERTVPEDKERKLQEAGCGSAVDNRLAWSLCLCEDFASMHLPTRSAPFVVLPRLIRIYFSIVDGECAVERDLGSMARELEAHPNLLDDRVSDIVVLRARGPKNRSDLVDQNGCPTNLANEQASLWRGVYGARLGLYNAKRNAQPGGPHRDKRTFGGVLEKVRVAAEAARRKASGDAGATAAKDARTLYGGMRRSYFAAPKGLNFGIGRSASAGVAHWQRTPLWNAKQEKIVKASVKKTRASMVMRSQRTRGLLAFPNPQIKRSGPEPPKPSFTTVCFLGAWADADKLTPRCRVVVGRSACLESQLCVVPSLTELCQPPTTEWLVHMVYIVGLGRPAVTKHAWIRAQGDPSALRAQDVVHHQPRSQESKATLAFTHKLKKDEAALYRAFTNVSNQTGSKWSVVAQDAAQPARTQGASISLSCVADVRAWIASERKIRNHRGPVAWNESGRSIV